LELANLPTWHQMCLG